MRSPVSVLAILCLFVFSIAGAQKWNWHYNNLRNLDKGPDLCRRISKTNDSAILHYVNDQCGSFLRHFRMIPAKVQARRCPGAHDAKCRHIQDKWRCSIKINLTGSEPQVVALRWCLEDIKDWDTLIKPTTEEEEEDPKGVTAALGNATVGPEGATGEAGVVTKKPARRTKKPKVVTKRPVPKTMKPRTGKKGKRKKPMGNTARPKKG